MSKTVIGIFATKEEADRAADAMRRLPDPGIKVKVSQRATMRNHGSGYGPVAYHAGPMPGMAISPEAGVLPAFSGMDSTQPQNAAATAVEVTCQASFAELAAGQLRSLGAQQVRP